MKTGIISDIHEDVIRLEASLRLLDAAGVDDVICLGDIVGYSIPFYGYLKTRDANRCVDLVRATCSATVIGNHDLFAVQRLPVKSGSFVFPDEWYSLSFAERQKRAKGDVFLYEDHELPSLLTEENKAWLRALPETVIKHYGTHNVFISHYASPDLTGCCTAEVSTSNDLSAHFDVLEMNHCIYGFSGNDHIPGMKIFDTAQVRQYGFEKIALTEKAAWITEPTISLGTVPNGVMLYDSDERTISVLPLEGRLHTLPLSI
ncbi:metallophosphoesterase family protein [Pectobacterium colocasium]|uniref:metallophosphoesterase family protein n=1 Tax=Pectobacterium colocasium TaxID=2878098 RepID=UPI001CD69EC5|nr:metallophosphoesterase family protein [Pectobacterium colocasium]